MENSAVFLQHIFSQANITYPQTHYISIIRFQFIIMTASHKMQCSTQNNNMDRLITYSLLKQNSESGLIADISGNGPCFAREYQFLRTLINLLWKTYSILTETDWPSTLTVRSHDTDNALLGLPWESFRGSSEIDPWYSTASGFRTSIRPAHENMMVGQHTKDTISLVTYVTVLMGAMPYGIQTTRISIHL